jgi:hypothetical protein
MHHIYTHFPEEFQGRILGQQGDHEALAKYWERVNLDEDPRYAKHPLREKPNFRTHCVPCFLHGDGVPYKKAGRGSSLMTTTWKSKLGTGGSTWDWLYLWDAYVKNIQTPEFKRARRDVMVWDWWHCLHGIFPEADPWKRPLDEDDTVRRNRAGHFIAGGFFMGISGFLGDIEFHVLDCV